MKKVTRLLILTAFVFPICSLSRAYAGAPHIGQPGYLLEHRQNPGLDPVGSRDPFRIEDPMGSRDPFRLEDPIGGNVPDNDRDYGRWRDPYSRDAYPPSGHDRWIGGDGDKGGVTAPLDGGISLLLAAGLGLGLKKARERRKIAAQRNVKNAE